MHLDDALRYGQPQASAALLLGDGIVGLLEFLKQPRLIVSGDPGSGVADRYIECAIISFRLDRDFARIGELNGITDKVDQDLRQAAAVAPAWGQLLRKLDLER